jgi:hypothetical protein
MKKWIIIDNEGNRRIADESEIFSAPIIDDGDINFEDGEVAFPNLSDLGNEKGSGKEVKKHAKIKRKGKSRKKNTKV